MFLLVDKPKGMTSHDVVNVVRRITGERKVGHAGTLDPNATGLLIIGVGREFTKKLGTLAKDTTKVYEAEIFLGEGRDTDDVDGRRLREPLAHGGQSTRGSGQTSNHIPKPETVKRILKDFVGGQEQTPPIYSAIKIKGEKAYDLARKGKEVKLDPRKITIHSIKLQRYDYPTLKITAEVSSGTYIRALARDIGEKLGVGAYLSNLRRTKIGRYDIKNAQTPRELGDNIKSIENI